MNTPVNTMDSVAQQFHLLFAPASPDRPFDSLSVPAGVSFLFAPLLRPPELLSVPPEAFADVLILEPAGRSRRQLLVLNPADGLLQVNGHPVPRVAALKVGDELTLNHGPPFFVTLFNRRHVGPPDSRLLKSACPFCRVNFAPASRVYHCACGAGIHSESTAEEAGTLDCLPLCEEGLCPVCRTNPIITEDGYTWLPEFVHA